MGKYRSVSTAEKRAELEAKGEPWPVCDCHGEPKRWDSKTSRTSGGSWGCFVKSREAHNRYGRSEKGREAARRYYESPLAKEGVARRNERRIRVGSMYLGMCGFTKKESEELLNGAA